MPINISSPSFYIGTDGLQRAENDAHLKMLLNKREDRQSHKSSKRQLSIDDDKPLHRHCRFISPSSVFRFVLIYPRGNAENAMDEIVEILNK